ncbi:MAG: hypothetical protein IJ733_02470 [Lachnospiraceae bacterium]|nr:hypothetical protein [Lachnospiraceae bacterium]
MEYLGIMFGVLGFLGFLSQSSLKGRVRELERQMARIKGTDYAEEKENLVQLAKGHLGQRVQIHFKEAEGTDIFVTNEKNIKCTLVDVDEDWILVHIEKKKSSQDKLFRLESVKMISVS